MATVYRSTDTGAPTYPASAANGGGAGALMDILKACLVDGFGSKPGAGWTVDYEDATAEKRRIAFSNGNGVFEVVTWGSLGAGFFIWDSITTPGSGAIYTDDWGSVTSTGVNGWKHEREPVPGVNTDSMASAYLGGIYAGGESSYAWTVFADEKAAWILFHFPEGSSNTEQGDSPNTGKGSYHLQLFIGAVKSPDLPRNSAGNFFIGFGGSGSPTQSSPTTGSSGNLAYFWGLRTPMGTVPSVGNNAAFEVEGFEHLMYSRNPVSSVRALLPAIINYNGIDAPNPTSISSSYSHYSFGSLPGVAQIGEHTSTGYFWVNYNEYRDASWSLEPATIGGYEWMPWSVGTSGLYDCGVTNHADWW
ncbi:hypothetical protein [Alcanivorax sp.]|uniref:hypothetical protein n=1 Tax=Alcanivorax sp. TaxID=1872427 RepID=UPI003A8F9096